MEPTEHHIVVTSKNLQGHHQENVVIYPITRESIEYRHLIKGATKAIWENSFANYIVRLAQVLKTRIPLETNTIFFIPKEKVPAARTSTYGSIVAGIRLKKAETHCTRLTVRVNLINFPDDVTTPTADLITAKLIFSSVLSTRDKKFMFADIVNFYLKKPWAYMSL